MSKKIIMLNASALRISHCKRRLHYVVIDGYRKKTFSQDIEFGSAFHLCPKVVYQTKGNIGAGVNAAREYFRTTPMELNPKKKYLNDFMLSKVCMDWFTSDIGLEKDSFEVLYDTNCMEEECKKCDSTGVFGLDEEGEMRDCPDCKGERVIKYPFGKPLTEVTFAIPYYAGENVEVILCGTIDKVVAHRQSKLICEGDFKTTTSWDELDYLRGYVLNTQRYFYQIALKHMIETSDSSSILHQYKGKDVGSFVDGIFVKSTGESIMKRGEVMVFTDAQRFEYSILLTDLCKWFDSHYHYVDGNPSAPIREGLLNGTCKAGYVCDFFDACACNDSVASEHVLRRNFIQQPYDPLHRSQNL